MGWFTSPIQVMPIGTYVDGNYSTWLGSGYSGGAGVQDTTVFEPGTRQIGGNYPQVVNLGPPPTYQPLVDRSAAKSLRLDLPASGAGIGPFTTRRVGLPDGWGSYPQWVVGRKYRLRYAVRRDGPLNVNACVGYIRRGPSPWPAAQTLLNAGAATFPITTVALNTWEFFAVEFTPDANTPANDVLFQFNAAMATPFGHIWLDQTYIEEWATSPPTYAPGFGFGF